MLRSCMEVHYFLIGDAATFLNFLYNYTRFGEQKVGAGLNSPFMFRGLIVLFTSLVRLLHHTINRWLEQLFTFVLYNSVLQKFGRYSYKAIWVLKKNQPHLILVFIPISFLYLSIFVSTYVGLSDWRTFHLITLGIYRFPGTKLGTSK